MNILRQNNVVGAIPVDQIEFLFKAVPRCYNDFLQDKDVERTLKLK